MFKAETLAVLFPPYPGQIKTNTAKFKSTAILSLAFFYGNGATHSHARSIAFAWLKHAHSFDHCGGGMYLKLYQKVCLKMVKKDQLRQFEGLVLRPDGEITSWDLKYM